MSVNLKSIFSWNSIAQKTNEILDKILIYEARAKFCQIFRSFFGQWSFKKNSFWDLLTFNMDLLFFSLRILAKLLLGKHQADYEVETSILEMISVTIWSTDLELKDCHPANDSRKEFRSVIISTFVDKHNGMTLKNVLMTTFVVTEMIHGNILPVLK
mgnify:CR=1 FL=1